MEPLAPHCIVEIEKTRFDSWKGENLIAASVDQTTDKTGEGSIELYDPKLEIIDKFLGGGIKALQARFWLGWGADLGAALFVGSLARVEWSERITTFRFHDHSAKMKKEKKTRYFKKKSDIQILKNLAADNDLKFSLQGDLKDSQPITSLMQAGKTDWETALKIAEKSGLRLYVSGDTLFAVEAGKTGAVVSSLVFEKDFRLLRQFHLSYKVPDNKKGRAKKTQVRGRGKGGKQLKGETTTGTIGTTDIIVREDLPKQSVEMLSRRAKGKSNRRREYAFEHRLQTLPSFRTVLNLRDTLLLAGMGKFFSGEHLVTDIRYAFRPGQLTADLTVGRDMKK